MIHSSQTPSEKFKKKPMEVFALLSDSQGKLGAIMAKMQSVLPFLEDSECERLFLLLSESAQKTLDSRSRSRSSAFNEMTMDELLKLAKPPGNCSKGVDVLPRNH